MEEPKVSRPRSVIRIILVIVGMLAFGAAGFYFGSQDTFHVNTKKKEKKEPVVEVQKEDDKEQVILKEDLTQDEKKMYISLVNLVKTTRVGSSNVLGGIDLTLMNDNEKLTVSNLDENDILDIVFKKTITSGLISKIDTKEDEDTYFENGYSSPYEYHITLDDLKETAKNFLNIQDFNNFPNTYYYSLQLYELKGEEYVGRETVGGFEGPNEYEYEVTGIKEGETTLIILVEQTKYLLGDDGFPDENKKEFSTFEFEFNIIDDDYQFVSVTKTK